VHKANERYNTIVRTKEEVQADTKTKDKRTYAIEKKTLATKGACFTWNIKIIFATLTIQYNFATL